MEAWQVHVKKDSLHLPRCSYTTGLVAAWKTNDGCCWVMTPTLFFHILSNLNAEKCAADPSKLYMLEYNMLERQFLIGMVRPDHRPGCVIVSEYIALLCAIGFQIFSLEPAYQFLLPVFCPYCEAVLLQAVFLIKMMFDVNEARWKVSTFSSIC